MKRILLIALTFLALPAFGATCKISEYAVLATDSQNTTVPVAVEPAPVTQNITYTTSTQSTAFASTTRFIRIVCDAKAHFSFGANPTATASSPYLPADTPEYFGIRQTGSLEVAFYDGSS